MLAPLPLLGSLVSPLGPQAPSKLGPHGDRDGAPGQPLQVFRPVDGGDFVAVLPVAPGSDGNVDFATRGLLRKPGVLGLSPCLECFGCGHAVTLATANKPFKANRSLLRIIVSVPSKHGQSFRRRDQRAAPCARASDSRRPVSEKTGPPRHSARRYARLPLRLPERQEGGWSG